MDCPECTYSVPDAMDQCPHCGRPALFPNVRQAEDPAEVGAVKQRYQKALTDAVGRGCSAVAQAFEIVAGAAQAVIGRSIEEALRLAKADNQGYATFYDLLHAGVRLPEGDDWTRLRGIADWELFGPFRDKIRFAALSADGACLPRYGEVTLELKESMIAHRATVFEENSAMFFKRQREQGNEPPVIAGSRALWSDRGKLALAKHEQDLAAASTSPDFPSILLRPGKTSAEDVFIEVHVYGSLTRRSLSRIVVEAARAHPACIVDLRDQLNKDGVTIPVDVR